MDPLRIERTESSPRIDLTPGAKEFIIEGESAPENARLVYFPVLEWLENYRKSAPANTPLTMRFSFDYLNSLSLKYIYDIIKKLEGLSEGGLKVSVIWDHMKDDDESRENGEEFSKLVKLDFKIQERK